MQPINDVFKFDANNEHDTDRFGAAFAELLEPGQVVALVGPLGAGKTRLVQAIAVALGVERKDVTSPTFLLIQEYAGRLPLYHFDTYRLRDSDEFLELGADELIYGLGVCLIEWADRVSDVLPHDLLRIEIETTGPTSRRFAVSGTGPRSSELADRLTVQLRSRRQPGMNT
ncbi:MAG: tRNA (adenosine(37)-N6)-threonylcarbamoyltransferase complex ATPase subunit type 1 TsaE [Planctomycetaceae bacterium]